MRNIPLKNGKILNNEIFIGIADIIDPFFVLSPGKTEVARGVGGRKHTLDKSRGRGDAGKASVNNKIVTFSDGIINSKGNGGKNNYRKK